MRVPLVARAPPEMTEPSGGGNSRKQPKRVLWVKSGEDQRVHFTNRLHTWLYANIGISLLFSIGYSEILPPVPQGRANEESVAGPPPLSSWFYWHHWCFPFSLSSTLYAGQWLASVMISPLQHGRKNAGVYQSDQMYNQTMEFWKLWNSGNFWLCQCASSHATSFL